MNKRPTAAFNSVQKTAQPANAGLARHNQRAAERQKMHNRTKLQPISASSSMT